MRHLFRCETVNRSPFICLAPHFNAIRTTINTLYVLANGEDGDLLPGANYYYLINPDSDMHLWHTSWHTIMLHVIAQLSTSSLCARSLQNDECIQLILVDRGNEVHLPWIHWIFHFIFFSLGLDDGKRKRYIEHTRTLIESIISIKNHKTFNKSNWWVLYRIQCMYN